MKEFMGRILEGSGTTYYESTYNGMAYCHDPSWLFDQSSDVPCWGYESPGTIRLASVMLLMAIAGEEGMQILYPEADEGYEDDDGNWVDGEGDGDPALRVDCWPDLVLRVRPLRHAFAEVLANLPDNWEMSRQEILDWIEKQEQQKDQDEQAKPAGQVSAKD